MTSKRSTKEVTRMSKTIDLSAIQLNDNHAATKTAKVVKAGRFQDVTAARMYLIDGPASNEVLRTVSDIIDTVKEALGLSSSTQAGAYVVLQWAVTQGALSKEAFEALVPDLQQVRKAEVIEGAVEDTTEDKVYLPLALAYLDTKEQPLYAARATKARAGQEVLWYDDHGNVSDKEGNPVAGHDKIPFTV